MLLFNLLQAHCLSLWYSTTFYWPTAYLYGTLLPSTGSLPIIIIIISIFKEDNVFSIIASLPYGPPINTDIDYYRTSFFRLFVSVATIVVRYLLREEKPVLVL